MSFYAKVKATQYRSQLRRLHPSYSGRTIILTEGDTARITDYWDEGNKAVPRLFNPKTGIEVPHRWNELYSHQSQNNPFNLNIGTIRLEPGVALCEHVYSGTRQYLRVTLHPTEDRTNWIS